MCRVLLCTVIASRIFYSLLSFVLFPLSIVPWCRSHSSLSPFFPSLSLSTILSLSSDDAVRLLPSQLSFLLYPYRLSSLYRPMMPSAFFPHNFLSFSIPIDYPLSIVPWCRPPSSLTTFFPSLSLSLTHRPGGLGHVDTDFTGSGVRAAVEIIRRIMFNPAAGAWALVCSVAR
jgi:hypothetical protein